jgi:heme exporter protein D
MDTGFFAMGGYAFYVWLAYGLSTGVLLINAVLPARRERSLLAGIAKRAQTTD